MKYNDGQIAAALKMQQWLQSGKQSFALGGLAGTGKSTLIPEFVAGLEDDGRSVTIGTPTGKAASVVNKKLSRTRLRARANTIHSIAYRPTGSYKEATRLDPQGRPVRDPIFKETEFFADIFIIDEASMVSSAMLKRLLSNPARYIFVGDHGQLPPIRESVSPALAKLDHALIEIVRTGDQTLIDFAYDCRQGKDFSHVPEGIHSATLGNFSDVAEYCIDSNIDFIVAPTNKVRHGINMAMRRQLGFGSDPVFSPGETVILTSNNYAYKIFNGERFVVEQVLDRQDDTEGEIVTVTLSDGVRRISNIELGYCWRTEEAFERGITAADSGYCLTCHKAQGSEAPQVAVIDSWIGWMGSDEQAAWRYTAVTRAQENVHIIKV